MRRYWRILQQFWATALAAELEYRINFAIQSFTSVLGLMGSLFGLFLFYRTGYTFAGWRWAEALLVVGLFTLLEGFSNAVLAPNLNRIVRHMQEGTLDFVLLKPMNAQFWLSTHTLSPWGLPDLIFGTIVVIYAGIQLGLPLTAYVLGLLPLGFGLVILYSLWFMLATTSVWFVKIYNVTEVLKGLMDAGRFPITAYPVAYRWFFTFVVPVAFLTTVPAEVMLGRSGWQWIVGSAGLAIGLLWLSDRFWRFALRSYTSASS